MFSPTENLEKLSSFLGYLTSTFINLQTVGMLRRSCSRAWYLGRGSWYDNRSDRLNNITRKPYCSFNEVRRWENRSNFKLSRLILKASSDFVFGQQAGKIVGAYLMIWWTVLNLEHGQHMMTMTGSFFFVLGWSSYNEFYSTTMCWLYQYCLSDCCSHIRALAEPVLMSKLSTSLTVM